MLKQRSHFCVLEWSGDCWKCVRSVSEVYQKCIRSVSENVQGGSVLGSSCSYIVKGPFIPEAYNMTEYIALYVYKFKAVCGYLNNHALKINEPFLPSMVLNLMMKPLSEVSNNPDDYGYTASDGDVYAKFDQYKDLPIVGLSSISDYTKRDCNPAAYVYLKYNTVGFLAI